MSQKGRLTSDLSQVGFRCNQCGEEFAQEKKLERHQCSRRGSSSGPAGSGLHPDSTASAHAHASNFGLEDAAGDDEDYVRGISADNLAGALDAGVGDDGMSVEVSGALSPSTRMRRNDSISSSSESSWDGGWANRGHTVDDENDGDGSPDSGGFGEDEDGMPLPPEVGHHGDNDEGGGTPWLHELHHQLGGKTMEGGAANLKFNTKARGSKFYPFRTITLQLLWMFVHKFQISREALCGLVAILQITYEGQGFDAKELEDFNAEHFYARMRECMPLLEIIVREVPSTQEGRETAKVYDTPLSLLLDRECRLLCSTDVSRKYPGGKIISAREAEENFLASDHVTSIPVKRKGDICCSNMNGKLARNTPFFGIDGICAQRSARKVYINDVCVCLMEDATAVLCRALEMYWDEAQRRVLVAVRRFRTASEVRNAGDDDKVEGLIRVWEDTSANSNSILAATAVLDLGEIYTLDEVQRGSHNTETWTEGPRSEWGPFVAEGFVRRVNPKKRGHTGGSAAFPPSFDISETPWAREGTGADYPLFTLRKPGFYFNRDKLPYFSAPCNWLNDAFNATRQAVKKSIGGGYFGWAWRNNAVQRKRRETHVATIAATGACYEGEIGYQCDILGMLQKGCLAKVRVQADDGTMNLVKVFLRGSLLLFCADSPRRATVLCVKHPNSWSYHPCPYCMVSQVEGEEDGGGLGDPQFDIDKNRRTLDEMEGGWKKLEALQDKSAAHRNKISSDLGLVIDAANRGRPLFDKLYLNPILHVPVERLHADALGTTANMQTFMLELLSNDGRGLVMSVMAQRNTLYPPGAEPLKCIVTNYSSLTGSDKWVLASFMLFVFKPVLQDVESMRRYLRGREIAKMVDRMDETEEGVLNHLRSLVQVTSKLAFAVRASSFSPAELDHLDLLCRDVVGHFAFTMGSVGIKPTTHSTLHYRQAVVNHGIIPDASTSEFAHQQSKTKIRSSGPDIAAHFARRANSESAVLAIANGLEYAVTMYHRGDKKHIEARVRPGAGCVAVMKQLDTALRLGLSGAPRDEHSAPTPTPAQLKGQYRGGATWDAVLWQEGATHVMDGNWLERMRSGYLRPDAASLLKGYKKFYGCARRADARCGNSRCPYCSWNPNGLDSSDIACSRYYHAAPYVASSGQGRWKGGDVKAAGRPGPHLDWVLGTGGGDDVEIWKNPPPTNDDGPVDASDLTIAKVIYFFKHKANAITEGDDRPDTWWVLVYDYSGIGRGNERVADHVTQHPVLRLRGRGRPLVYPADAIRRQLHLYHKCPLGDGGEWTCGQAPVAPDGSGREKVWRHKFKLASTSAGDGYDHYLLNEFHHTASRDSFID